jgi:hypothetical protein
MAALGLSIAMQCTPADVAREVVADAAVLAGPNPWLVADSELPALCSSFPLGALTRDSSDSVQNMRDALVARHAVAHARQALRQSTKARLKDDVGPTAFDLPDTPTVVSLGCVALCSYVAFHNTLYTRMTLCIVSLYLFNLCALGSWNAGSRYTSPS